jgi:hypothetical protein
MEQAQLNRNINKPAQSGLIIFKGNLSPMTKKYKTLKQFYPFYLSQHQNKICRLLHIIGTMIAIGFLIAFVISIFYSIQWKYLLFGLISGYGFAWVGHFFFEKNKPATFEYPLFSLASDFILLFNSLFKKSKS